MPKKPRKHNTSEARTTSGAHTILTPTVHMALVHDVADGDFRNAIAVRNGVHPKTLQLWLTKGLADNAEEPYASFTIDFLMAEAELRAKWIKELFKTKQMARVAAITWYLERRFRDWSRQKKEGAAAEIFDAIDENIVEAKLLNTEQAQALVPRLLADPRIRALFTAHGCTIPERAYGQQSPADSSGPSQQGG